jgi:SAM-dependent methyltransferase
VEKAEVGLGVIKVDHSRWEEAQRYEKRTWMEKGKGNFNDRNEYHRERFAHYSALQGKEFIRAIELGCGPFTNMRFINKECTIREIHLLDPLLSAYYRHPFCQYSSTHLGGIKRYLSIQRLRHPFSLLRKIMHEFPKEGLNGVPIIPHVSMIEEFDTEQKFDLVAMINVIEHCQDARKVFSKIDEILMPGGILVFHDNLYDAETVEILSKSLYDVGHPLRVDRSITVDYLEANYLPLMNDEYKQKDSFHGIDIERSELYFIGRRKSDK